MFLWVILFLLVIAISFLLALQSMKDYQEIPHRSKEEYSLFLIRKTQNLNADILDSILNDMQDADSIISIERLFKGKQTTLTIFGPKKVLEAFNNELALLELEDYASSLNDKSVYAWEMGVREVSKFDPEKLDDIFKDLPGLVEEDQFFWQVILGKNQTQIRAALYSADPVRRDRLIPIFQNLKMGELIKVPKPFSNEQMMAFYKMRALSVSNKSPRLDPEGVIRLLRFS